jgi:hypothetical protein
MSDNKGDGVSRFKADGASQGSPVGRFLTADGFLNSARSLAGPLRTGTSPDVGPRAQGVTAPGRAYDSDFGMDRVSPREFDPMGTSLRRYRPEGVPSALVTEQVRRPRRSK